jgi:hypothetical protein
VSGQLLSHGGPADARCKHCGAVAVGPCARCRSPVCGDCCVLTQGGTQPWAICLGCDRSGGRSLSAGWWMVIGWLLWPILGMLAFLVVLYLAFG